MLSVRQTAIVKEVVVRLDIAGRVVSAYGIAICHGIHGMHLDLVSHMFLPSHKTCQLQVHLLSETSM